LEIISIFSKNGTTIVTLLIKTTTMNKMKLIIASLLSMFMLNTVKAQAIFQGDVIIDGYYGFPNLYKTVFKAANASSGNEMNLNVKGIGPLGGRVEYLLTDKVGLGLDIGFTNTHIDYLEKEEVYNENTGNFEDKVYRYDLDTRKIGIMVTFNYHFVENSEKVDAYVMAGAGYANRNFNVASTNPDFNNDISQGLIPIALRIGVGMRYFFTENFGANVAVGIGQGGILNAGLSFKL